MKTLMIVTITAVMLSSGCKTIIDTGPPRTNHYYINPRADIAAVGRVALLELDNLTTRQELGETFTLTLADELGKRNLFSLRKVMRADAIWQSLKLDNMQAHTLDDLAAARQALSANAVLFGTIQRYMSFPHLQISLTLKLVDTRSGHLLWAFEDVWDSGDKTVEKRMQKYFKEQMRTGFEPMDWQILITSPLAFNRFVAWEVAQTLPN
jgi:TolB-like protein